MKALLIGNLTIDHNITESGRFVGPGGSVYFAAKTFENLKVEPTIVSPYGDDFPKGCLPKTNIYPDKPLNRKTLVFENIYCKDDIRKQRIKNYPKDSFERVENVFNQIPGNQQIVFVAPIINNISEELIFKIRRTFPKSLFVLSPQGFFRKVREEGKIVSKKWLNEEKVIHFFDIIILSDKDTKDADGLAKIWSRYGPIAIVTKEAKGSTLYEKGERADILPFLIGKISDSTGAGDVFTAAFAFAYQKTYNASSSSLFANAAAAFSLPFLPNQLQYGYRDIINFALKHKRKIKI